MIDDEHLAELSNESILSDEPTAVAGEPMFDRHDPAITADAESSDTVGEQPPAAKPRSRRRKYVKRALLVVVVLLIPVTYSYVRALTGPGTDSLQARTVEWARDNHLGGAVDRIEKYWYAHHQAKVGGTPTANADQLNLPVNTAPVAVAPKPTNANPPSAPVAAPAVGAIISSSSPVSSGSTTNPASAATNPAPAATNAQPQAPAPGSPPRPALPAALVTPAATPVAQEGQWSGIGQQQPDGRFGAYATLIRPDAVHSSVLDAVVWIDPSALTLRQYPGTKIPGAPWDRPDFIEPDRQASLVAAFEGGFRLADSNGGMFLGGAQLKPMRDGGATFAINADGVPNIGMWGRDFTSTAGLDSARQNLDLIVDGGAVSPRLATDANRTWGFTGPANKDAVWRSGAGVTADGALIWVGGDGLSIQTLADTLVRAGAVRGMQLDINHEWVQFNTYTVDASGAVHGEKLLAAMQHSGSRYLSEDTRDFIAVFRRS